MAGSYDRRNLNPYFHRGGGGNPLPSSYRNKAYLIVMATALYAAFLHHSGACALIALFLPIHSLVLTYDNIVNHAQKGGAGQFLESGEQSSSPPDQSLANAARDGMKAMSASKQHLQIASWNIAAINNNPFEYWITYDENENYEKIMSNVEEFLERPGDKDVAVSQVFTEEMFGELEKRMLGVGWDSVRSYWENDFRDRKIVSGFMKVGNVEQFVFDRS